MYPGRKMRFLFLLAPLVGHCKCVPGFLLLVVCIPLGCPSHCSGPKEGHVTSVCNDHCSVCWLCVFTFFFLYVCLAHPTSALKLSTHHAKGALGQSLFYKSLDRLWRGERKGGVEMMMVFVCKVFSHFVLVWTKQRAYRGRWCDWALTVKGYLLLPAGLWQKTGHFTSHNAQRLSQMMLFN